MNSKMMLLVQPIALLGAHISKTDLENLTLGSSLKKLQHTTSSLGGSECGMGLLLFYCFWLFMLGCGKTKTLCWSSPHLTMCVYHHEGRERPLACVLESCVIR